MSATTPMTVEAIDFLGIDADNRRLAIDPRQSFIIEAPAGAGKTELLTQRLLALLAKVNDPEEIVALTFTKKAAAEMRDRVIRSLRQSASRVKPPEAHKQITFELGLEVLKQDDKRQWGLLDNPGRLQITTLDALCAKLARQMPLLSNFGSQPGITDDAKPYYEQAAQETLRLLEHDDDPASDSVARVLDYFDTDTGRFQALLVSMLESRDQWLKHSFSGVDLLAAEKALAVLIEIELRIFKRLLTAEVQTQLMPVIRYAAAQALVSQAAGELPDDLSHLVTLETWTDCLQDRIEDLPRWRGLLELLLTKAGAVRATLPRQIDFRSADAQELALTLTQVLQYLRGHPQAGELKRIQKLPTPGYLRVESQLIQDLLVVLKRATLELWLAFQAKREVDFTQMAQNALLALGTEDEPTDLQLKLDYQIKHLLVDEFQDTSPTQVDLLKRLTAGWEAEQDGRTLFLVGDPMQSIYKFRKADVGLFLKVRQNGLGPLKLKPLNLYRNNRSHREVVEWVNAEFPKVFAPEDNHHLGAVKFTHAQATKGEHELARVAFHPIIKQNQTTNKADVDADSDTDDLPLTPANQREAQTVIQLIQKAQAEDPQGSIAILVRARTHLEALVAELRLLPTPIPFKAVDIEGLGERQVIQDLMSLTYAMHHLADRIHWLAILRAPWCGLKLEDLHLLAADDHQSSIWSLMQNDIRLSSLSTDGEKRLKDVRKILQEAFDHEGRQRPKRWLEGVWHALGGTLCLENESDLLDAYAYFQVIDRLTVGGVLDLKRLAPEVEKLFAAADPAPSKVEIMTIHKSKGLEFDTVILPGLHRKAPPNDKKLLLWDEVLDAKGKEQLVVAPVPHGMKGEEDGPSKYGFLSKFETERSQNEMQRLLYVAVTRAKRQLHLVGVAAQGKDEDTLVVEPAKGSLLAMLWHAAHTSFEEAAQALQEMPPQAANGVTVEPALFNHQLVRLAQTGMPDPLMMRSAQELTAPSEKMETVQGDKKYELGLNGETAAHIGTLVHRYLELIATDGLTEWPIERVMGCKRAMLTWMKAQGHDTEDAEQASQEVLHNLLTTLKSEQGRWILQQHDQAGTEVAFTTTENGMPRSHVVDRTFVDQGVRWIIDYKTTKMPPDENNPVMAEMSNNYRQQLQRYANLYASSEKVAVGIYFSSLDILWKNFMPLCEK